MRILIISFDGLEHNWVEMFNLVGLKQKEYGRIDLYPILNLQQRKHKDPVTDEIYATTISGKLFIEGITGEGVCTICSLSERNIPSIFNLPNSLAVGVPTASYDVNRIFHINLIAEYVRNDKEIQLKELLLADANKMTNVLINERSIWIQKQLVMVYYYFTDELGHLSRIRLNDAERFDVYKKAEEIAVRLKQRFLEFGDGIVIIHSDHGMDNNGRHSHHGFYSLSKPLNWKGIKVTELHDRIKELYHET